MMTIPMELMMMKMVMITVMMMKICTNITDSPYYDENGDVFLLHHGNKDPISRLITTRTFKHLIIHLNRAKNTQSAQDVHTMHNKPC